MAEQNNNASSTEEVRLPPVNMRKFRIMSIWFVRFFCVLLISCFILSNLPPKSNDSFQDFHMGTHMISIRPIA